MTKVDNKKTLENVKIGILIGCLALFCVWLGFTMGLTLSANMLDDVIEDTDANAATNLANEMASHPESVSTVQLPFVVGDTESGDNTAGD